MSKSKAKNRTEIEFLKGQIRRLKKQVLKVKKGQTVTEEELEEYLVDDDPSPDCPACGKGMLRHIDLKHIIVTSCNVCDYSEKRKPSGKT